MQHRIAALLYALALSACEPIADDPATPSPQPQAPDVTGSKQPAPEGGPATMPAPPVVSIKRLDGTGNLRSAADEVTVIPPDSQEIADPGSVDSLEYKIKCNAWSAGNTYKIDFTVTDSFNHPDGPAGSDKETLTVTCEDCSKGTAAQPKCSGTTNFCKTLSDSSTPPNTTHYCDACPKTCGGHCDGTTNCTSCNNGWHGGQCQTDCTTPDTNQHCKAADTTTDPDTRYYACQQGDGSQWYCTECAAGWHSTSSTTRTCSTACANAGTYHCTETALTTAICDRNNSGNQIYTGAILSCDDCLDGWYGQNCRSDCKPPVTGQNCKANATSGGTTTHYYACDQGGATNTSGWHCTACATGYYGTTCGTPCSNEPGGTTPTHCKSPTTSTCNQEDGAITVCSTGAGEGCAAGHHNPDNGCKDTCTNSDSSTSGPHCANTAIATCDTPTDGTISNCNGSCIDGWYGTDCAQSCRTHNSGSIGNCTATATITCAQNGGGNPVCSACTTGHYGPACASTCANNGSTHCYQPGSSTCDKSSGVISTCSLSGGKPNCESGWYGTTCSTACSSKRTNSNHCADNATYTCDSSNGGNLACNPCADGYWGTACTTHCTDHCKTCASATTCGTCEDGFVLSSGTCQSPSSNP